MPGLKIHRKWALTIYAVYRISLLSDSEIKDVLFAEYNDEDGLPIDYKTPDDENVQDFLVHHFCEYVLYGISNDYLKKFIEMRFNQETTIVGLEPHLEKCPCCGYQTLPERGAYDICAVCQWEDDGRSEDRADDISSVNHMSLRDYRLRWINESAGESVYFKKG